MVAGLTLATILPVGCWFIYADFNTHTGLIWLRYGCPGYLILPVHSGFPAAAGLPVDLVGYGWTGILFPLPGGYVGTGHYLWTTAFPVVYYGTRPQPVTLRFGLRFTLRWLFVVPSQRCCPQLLLVIYVYCTFGLI